MTIRKKNLLNSLSLIAGLILMVGVSNYSLNKVSDSSLEIQKITERVQATEEFIKEHEEYGYELLMSFMNQTDFNGETDHKADELGEWLLKVESEAAFNDLPENIQEGILNLKEPHQKMHEFGKSYVEDYVRYDRDLENKLLQMELVQLKEMNELFVSIMSRKVSQVPDDIKKTEFAKWYASYMNSPELKMAPKAIQAKIKSLAADYKNLHQAMAEVKNLEKSGDYIGADSVFKRKASSALNAIQSKMGEIIVAQHKVMAHNANVKKMIEEELPKVLDTMHNSLELYSGHIKSNEKALVEERNETISLGTNSLIAMSLMAVLVVAWAIMIGLEVLKKIESFRQGMIVFFRYLNKESDNVDKLEESKDEIGDMANMVNCNVDRIVENLNKENRLIGEVNDLVLTVKSGDLTKRVSADVENEALNKLKDELNNMVEEMEIKMGSDINSINAVLGDFANYDFRSKVAGSKGEVKENVNKVGELIQEMLLNNQLNSKQLINTSAELKENISNLSLSSNEQAANLEEVAASIEEISGNIRNNGEKSNVLQGIADKMGTLTESGTEKISAMTVMIEKVAESQRAIDEAIKVIDQIAFQTNILSLNAAVEAATAGEHGRGFAVVATEVRNLAAKSAEAANEIKALVTTGTDLVQDSTELSKDVNASFGQLVDSITETSGYIKEITEATNEQSLAITQIAETMSALDTMTQGNATMASRTNEISDETNEIAQAIENDIKDKEFDGKEIH